MNLDKFPYYYNAPKSTIENAKVLRLNLTPSEKIIWNILRNEKSKAVSFADNILLDHTLLIFMPTK
jgi:very-short-patch-repair endonuclease